MLQDLAHRLLPIGGPVEVRDLVAVDHQVARRVVEDACSAVIAPVSSPIAIVMHLHRRAGLIETRDGGIIEDGEVEVLKVFGSNEGGSPGRRSRRSARPSRSPCRRRASAPDAPGPAAARPARCTAAVDRQRRHQVHRPAARCRAGRSRSGCRRHRTRRGRGPACPPICLIVGRLDAVVPLSSQLAKPITCEAKSPFG